MRAAIDILWIGIRPHVQTLLGILGWHVRTVGDFVAKRDYGTCKHTFGLEFTREKAGEHGESIGAAKLYIDDQGVAESPMKTQPGKSTLSGDGLCVGFDSGDAVSQEDKSPGKFTGGTIFAVGITVEKAQYLDLEREATRIMMVQ